MKRFLRATLYALILILVGLVSALTAMRFAIHGREVIVPKVVGLTPAQAKRIAVTHDLVLIQEEHFYSSEAPEGQVLSQLPTPGTRVRVGYRLRVAESLGPQKVEIPDLTGESTRAAELNLRRLGLDVGSVAQFPTSSSAADVVIAQTPTPDAQKVSTPTVGLLVSEPPAPQSFVMPDFVGSKISEAAATVRSAGLVVGSISSASAAAPANTPEAASGAQSSAPLPPPTSNPRTAGERVVVRQTPAPGQRVSPGATVQFVVSPG